MCSNFRLNNNVKKITINNAGKLTSVRVPDRINAFRNKPAL
jgi:hypothetical protein